MITIKKLKDKLSKYANKEDGKIYVKSIENGEIGVTLDDWYDELKDNQSFENGEPLINTITIFEKNYIKLKSDDIHDLFERCTDDRHEILQEELLHDKDLQNSIAEHINEQIKDKFDFNFVIEIHLEELL